MKSICGITCWDLTCFLGIFVGPSGMLGIGAIAKEWGYLFTLSKHNILYYNIPLHHEALFLKKQLKAHSYTEWYFYYSEHCHSSLSRFHRAAMGTLYCDLVPFLVVTNGDEQLQTAGK